MSSTRPSERRLDLVEAPPAQRRGSPGTMRLDSYQQRNEAETAERRPTKRRLQHGYTTLARSV